jgi:hypothetical protein
MSKIHNMVRTIGQPGSEEFDLPKGWTLYETVYLGPADKSEQAAGFFKVLYVLVPEVIEPVVEVRRGRPPVQA